MTAVVLGSAHGSRPPRGEARARPRAAQPRRAGARSSPPPRSPGSPQPRACRAASPEGGTSRAAAYPRRARDQPPNGGPTPRWQRPNPSLAAAQPLVDGRPNLSPTPGVRRSHFWIVLFENYLRPPEAPDLALRPGFRELINQEMVQKENDLVRGMPGRRGGSGPSRGSGAGRRPSPGGGGAGGGRCGRGGRGGRTGALPGG